jgi:hypothetical protein
MTNSNNDIQQAPLPKDLVVVQAFSTNGANAITPWNMKLDRMTKIQTKPEMDSAKFPKKSNFDVFSARITKTFGLYTRLKSIRTTKKVYDIPHKSSTSFYHTNSGY